MKLTRIFLIQAKSFIQSHIVFYTDDHFLSLSVDSNEIQFVAENEWKIPLLPMTLIWWEKLANSLTENIIIWFNILVYVCTLDREENYLVDTLVPQNNLGDVENSIRLETFMLSVYRTR